MGTSGLVRLEDDVEDIPFDQRLQAVLRALQDGGLFRAELHLSTGQVFILVPRDVE